MVHRFTFSHPTTILLAGPTMSGKTFFLTRVMTEWRFTPEPQRIVVVYGEWQPAYEELQRHISGIEFIKNFTKELYETLDPRVRNLVILDDQMENRASKKRSDDSVVKYFTQGAHHRNLTVVYIVQNLFNQDPVMRTVSLNSHYLVLFNNPRDKTQISTLGRQMYPEYPRFLRDAYRDATERRYGHLLIDLRPSAREAMRVMTDVLDEPVVYLPVERWQRTARDNVDEDMVDD